MDMKAVELSGFWFGAGFFVLEQQRVCCICLEMGGIALWRCSLKVTVFSALHALNTFYVWSRELGLQQINTLPKIRSEYVMRLFNNRSYCPEGSRNRIWPIV